MNSIKQPVTFACEICHIAWQVYHSLDETYYCDECGAVLYRPSVVKEHVFGKPTRQSDKAVNFK